MCPEVRKFKRLLEGRWRTVLAVSMLQISNKPCLQDQVSCNVKFFLLVSLSGMQYRSMHRKYIIPIRKYFHVLMKHHISILRLKETTAGTKIYARGKKRAALGSKFNIRNCDGNFIFTFRITVSEFKKLFFFNITISLLGSHSNYH
jgi:hypothetical protein